MSLDQYIEKINVPSDIKTRTDYFTPVIKRTSIGNSTRSKPKNKHKLKSWKKYNRQGKP